MFYNLVFQQHFQTTLSTSVFRRNPPQPVQIYDHPLKLAVYDTRPRWLGYVQNDHLEECSGVFGVLKLL